MAAIGSSLSIDRISINGVSAGIVENVTIALANTEQSHTFPAGTKEFMIQARTSGKIKLSFDPGTSGTAYWTIWYGAFVRQNTIDSATTTIYFQSPTAGLEVELLSWS